MVSELSATWLAVDDPGNPFGVELLDLMVTQTLVATSEDPAIAERAVSWNAASPADLDISAVRERPATACAIHFYLDRSLPDGFLFAPASMDEKWAIAWRAGTIIAVRSWTGAVEAIGEARIERGALVVERIRVTESSPLVTFGNPPETFEWLLRSHALREKLPFPVHAAGAAMFERAPVSAFSAFGNVIFCAAKTWQPPPPSRPLRSNGAIIRALRAGNLDEIEQLVAAGADIDAPSTHAGYTALYLAIVRGDTATVERLLALGADPNRRVDRGMFAIGIAIVHDAPPETFAALERGGADHISSNADGFTGLHAACEVGNAWAVRWLVERGHALELRTNRGHTPLQIACALGHLAAAQAIVELGADVDATSPDGSALDIAKRQGKPAVVAWLESR